MTKTFLASTALALTLGLPAAALDLGAMTDAERAAFGEAVRAYLIENPEVIMEAVSVLEQRQQQQAEADDLKLLADNSDALFNDQNSWLGGNPDGDITVVEFLDYRCGYCRKAWEEVEELVKTDGNIRFVIKEFPILGEQSLISSKFAIATRMVAGDEAYKKVHDALITLRGDATPESLTALAVDLGLDGAAIVAKMETPEVKAIIDANHALGTTMQINGTPSFVIDQTMVRGYVPLDGMRQIVEGQRQDG
ncbi:DsbA family protein [Gemmobacter lutimaris]|uniref:DsbA family protein n=1 Tax=Gemmobacter lutimaris TaxID=2306023 RepID=A0A398BT61_9RHOB|nr:DsbA family protein [Gemmobacter lutimaris]RID93572.1 DsbA family protein [Gemmobacter lutimaris]